MKGKIPIKAAGGETKALCRHAAGLGRQFAEAVLNGTVTPAPEGPTEPPDAPAAWDGSGQ